MDSVTLVHADYHASAAMLGYGENDRILGQTSRAWDVDGEIDVGK
jgi:hypothetical protein